MTQYTKTARNGTVFYYRDADCTELHRILGPAVEHANGTRKWYLNGNLHRTDGPAVERADGDRIWYLNDRLHRIDGPAIEWANGTRHWFLNGQRHRILGPAIEWATGNREWYLNGSYLTFSTWLVSTPVTDAERLMLALKYSEHACS